MEPFLPHSTHRIGKRGCGGVSGSRKRCSRGVGVCGLRSTRPRTAATDRSAVAERARALAASNGRQELWARDLRQESCARFRGTGTCTLRSAACPAAGPCGVRCALAGCPGRRRSATRRAGNGGDSAGTISAGKKIRASAAERTRRRRRAAQTSGGTEKAGRAAHHAARRIAALTPPPRNQSSHRRERSRRVVIESPA